MAQAETVLAAAEKTRMRGYVVASLLTGARTYRFERAVNFVKLKPCGGRINVRQCFIIQRAPFRRFMFPNTDCLLRARLGKTKAAAKAKLTEVLRDHEDGLAIAPTSYTVANAVNDWLSYGLNGRDKGTITQAKPPTIRSSVGSEWSQQAVEPLSSRAQTSQWVTVLEHPQPFVTDTSVTLALSVTRRPVMLPLLPMTGRRGIRTDNTTQSKQQRVRTERIRWWRRHAPYTWGTDPSIECRWGR